MAPVDVAGLTAWILPFATVTYLALEGGGYDTVVRGQVGIVLWWVVLIGAMAGVLPAAIQRRGWLAIGLLGLFLAWTLLSLTWTESSERSVIEVGRVATLLGALVVGLVATGQGRQRQVIGGVATATALIAGLAVMSRLRPGWFPANGVATGLGDFRRLSYPVNYWNALAAFVAMGLPAMLSVASGARSLIVRGLAAASLPVMGLCVFLTVSRGGLAAVVVALVIFLIVAPDRLAKVATVVVAGAGTAVLLAGANARMAIRDGVSSSSAYHQANELLAMIVVVAVGVFLLQLAVSLVDRHAERMRWMVVSRRRALALSAAAVVLGVVVAIGAGAPGALHHDWQKFKNPQQAANVKQDTTFSRLASLSGRGRYQMWQAAAREQSTRPLQGTGAGTFEYWWARHRGKAGGFVRDTHSLYMQTFGELGIVGLVLIGGFLLLLLIGGFARAFTAAQEHRLPIAAATAGIAAFVAEASIDWIWQVTVIPVMLMLLGAVVLSSPMRSKRLRAAWPARAVAIVAAVACLPLIGVSVAGSSAVADSQSAVNHGDLVAALADARTAVKAQPYAATPRLQEALVLEAGGDLPGAATAAAQATSRESTNWRTWLIRSRIEAERGHERQAVKLFKRARALNPESSIFRSGR